MGDIGSLFNFPLIGIDIFMELFKVKFRSGKKISGTSKLGYKFIGNPFILLIFSIDCHQQFYDLFLLKIDKIRFNHEIKIKIITLINVAWP